jgi:hypothetical protein
MFFSPRAWLTIVGLCCAMLGLLLNWEIGFPAIGYFSGDDAQIRNTLAQRASQHVVLELSEKSMLMSGRPSVAVANVVDDYRAAVTTQLKTWMARRNVNLVSDGRLSFVSNMFRRRPTTVSEAIEPYLDGVADYIIAADIDNWTTYPEYQAKLIGTVYLFDKQGVELASIPLSPEDAAPYLNMATASKSKDTSAAESLGSPPTEVNQERSFSQIASRNSQGKVHASLFPGVQIGIMIWGACVILGPWMFQSQIRRVLYRRDNRANAQMLLVWGASCGGVLWLLMTLGGLSSVTSIVSLMAGVMSCSYFAYVCEKIGANY